MKHVDLLLNADLFAWASHATEPFGASSLMRAYLIAWMFWLGVSLGSQVLIWLRALTGGAWGEAIRVETTAAAQLLPLLALGVIPILLNLSAMYPWMHAEHIDPILEQKLSYLNPKWFTIRAIAYFSTWILMGFWTGHLRRTALSRPTERTERAYRRGCALALLFYGVGMTFAAVDWGMSLEPHWFSASYGLLFIFGQALGALSFAVAIGARRVSATHNDSTLGDLGNLLLALTMLWTYITITQFLIIWFGDLPEEISWYHRRITEGWQWLAILLAAGSFFAPFMLLLRRGFKRDPQTLAYIAIAILVGRWFDLEWNLAPPFGPFSVGGMLLDLVMVAGIGVAWWMLFSWRRSALLRDEPQPSEAIHA